MSTFFAHSLPEIATSGWETMQQHEDRVAVRCAAFLARFDRTLESWGELLGRWHDLGKYSNEFQTYLHRANDRLEELDDIHRAEVSGKVDHSTAAAQLAVESFGRKGRLLAYIFAGHHAGLPDWDDGTSHSGLKQRLDKSIRDWSLNCPSKLSSLPFPGMPGFKKTKSHEIAAFRVSFFIRMVFSALVDADFLATESFMSPERAELRPKEGPALDVLLSTLENALEIMNADATDSRVNVIRHEVSSVCKTKAELTPGFFSLAVPTGGGKTLASLRFALHHAIAHELDRVIFGVPFTSIIDQNAKVYRDLFAEIGPNAVLEHHSNLDPEKESAFNRLQAENWDAPIVVTTNVQFFESLFACRTSRCRKLHRIAKSVIVLDEAQTLPIELLKPTMLALRELVESFGCTIVLCSATQPALEWRDDFPIGLQDIRPIIDKPLSLHNSLKRARVQVVGKLSDVELVQQLDGLNQVLCIVNTRPQAAKIFELFDEPGAEDCFHLSTRMCAAHRMEALTRIRERLKHGHNCRVISTQLIEAGVDVDFPVVYRSSCGLDSLAQAAGRCNREGLRPEGRVIFFKSPDPPPPGFLRRTADSTNELMDRFDDLLSPEAIQAYFELHYWKKSSAWDQQKVFEAIGKSPNQMQFNFREVAERYRFIREESEDVLVGYGDEGIELIRQLENPNAYVHRNTWRKLQRFSVQVRQHELARLSAAGAVRQMHERWVLVQKHLYEERLGLQFGYVDGILPVTDLMC